MKVKQIYLLGVGVVLVAVLAVYFLKRPVPDTAQLVTSVATAPPKPARLNPDALQKDRLGRFAHMSADELMRNRPKMHATKAYPPTTPEEIEMWQWWNAIDKADPSFEWKMPVEFYGKVVDQRQQLVSGATVTWTISVIGGSKAGTTLSGADGQFSLTGLVGKGITVRVSKKGYNVGHESMGDFEYAAFHEDGFIIPDPSNPVVFHLQKLDNPEPLYQNRINGHAPDDGTPVAFDIRLGKVTSDGSGDLVLKFKRSERPPSHNTGYILTIEAPPGGGLVSTNQEFMDSAPESGYQQAIRIEQRAKQGPEDYSFHVSQDLKFYVRTPDGKYAAVTGSVNQSSTPTAGYNFIVYYNPSGSRNLAVDMKKLLPTPKQ